MAKIVLDVRDEKKIELLMAFMRDLPYVDAQIDSVPKKWKGHLSALDNPIHIPGFRAFSREELHER